MRIGVFQAQPTLPQGVLACLAEHPPGTTDCDFPLGADPLLATYQDALRDAVERNPGVTLLDPTAWICPGGTCPALIDGVRVHIDDNHVSEEFVLAHERELGLLAATSRTRRRRAGMTSAARPVPGPPRRGRGFRVRRGRYWRHRLARKGFAD